MTEKNAVQTCITGVILVFLGLAAYFGRQSNESVSFIAIAGFLLLLLAMVNVENPRHQKVSVLIPDFRDRQWYANVEIDPTERLIAPTDPLDRTLTPADGVTKGINILRAPHYEKQWSSIVMLGALYEIAPEDYDE